MQDRNFTRFHLNLWLLASTVFPPLFGFATALLTATGGRIGLLGWISLGALPVPSFFYVANLIFWKPNCRRWNNASVTTSKVILVVQTALFVWAGYAYAHDTQGFSLMFVYLIPTGTFLFSGIAFALALAANKEKKDSHY